LPLLVWRCEEHPACKNWVMRCWCGYLSGARCRLLPQLAQNPTISCFIVIIIVKWQCPVCVACIVSVILCCTVLQSCFVVDLWRLEPGLERPLQWWFDSAAAASVAACPCLDTDFYHRHRHSCSTYVASRRPCNVHWRSDASRLKLSLFNCAFNPLSAFSALTLLVGWQEGHLACKKCVVGYWHGYLSGARCRLAYGPAVTVSCFNKIQIGFTFLVPAHPGSPG